MNCGKLCDFIKKYTQFLKCILLSTIHEHFYQIQEYLQLFDTTKKNNIIPTLKKAPKESHFKQLITKYTLIEFSPFITQNKHHTYLNSIKKTIFLYLLMKHINPKNPKMSIGVIQFRIICTVNDELEITQYIMRINTLDSYALNFACKPNKLS